ncbi:MAG: hypothetical protein JWO24_3348 [Rhodospirillales bacterium]|nr:hypothetical protein [Rhodospirillales bacterium]
MTERKAVPASEAEVVEAMAVARYHGAFGGVPWELLSPVVRAGCLNAAQKDITAARALGCLMPDEAAALREKVKLRDQWREEDGARWVATAEERDALAARLAAFEAAHSGTPAAVERHT